MTVPIDLANYPITDSARKQLARPLFGHFIEGTLEPSSDGRTMPVIDPSTGTQVATAASGNREDVDRAVRSARRAYEDGRWRFLPPLEQERRLRRLAAMVLDHADELSAFDCIESGLLYKYTSFVAEFAAEKISYYAGWPTKVHGTVPPAPREFIVNQLREPLGVVAVISPWNGPMAAATMVAAPLSMGNSVILKPAEQTPMSATRLAEIALEAGIPEGVFNLVQGPGEVAGAALVEHPDVAGIYFTGSVEVGRRIQSVASARLKRVTLELGGKSPLIIFPDADLDKAVAAALRGVWNMSGQTCTASSRVVVHQDVHDEVVARILEGSRDLKVGGGFDETTDLGPVISGDQLERIQGYVQSALAEGAELALGGSRTGEGGYFHEPTVFTGVKNSMRIAQEEIFGPVMGVQSFQTEDEAFRIANDVDYGLAAGVWTKDIDRAYRASRAIDAGTVWINSYQSVYPSVAYGGVKQSGTGRSLGEPSLEEFTHVKSIWTTVN